jgi:tungstate transport system substrate-binding protein
MSFYKKYSAVGAATLLTVGLLIGSGPAASQAQKSILVSSTTSTEQSGLFGHILPVFTNKTGIAVKVVAVGTGQALDIGRRGDADVVFVHDKAAEELFVSQGFSDKRQEVMFNDFVLLGPKSDPAKIAGGKDIQVSTQERLPIVNLLLCRAAIRVAPMQQNCVTGKAQALKSTQTCLGIKKLDRAWALL